MIHRSFFRHLLLATTLAASVAGLSANAEGPVKVFLLAGQSNMQGHGVIDENIDGVETIGTLRDWVNKNPASYGHLLDGSGDWIVRDDAWCWVRQGAAPNPDGDTFSTGDLTVGFGAGTNGGPTSGRFGPEFGFGIELADYFDEPVVLVKTAWGGASLFGDFRPPSAVAKRGGSVGFFYQRMMSAWQDAQAAIASRYPGREIELAGFGWHQGFNDRLNASSAAEYEANLADLIIDIRADLNAPALPVVITTTSMGGYPNEPYDAGETRWLQVQDAQLAMEPRENVTTVLTAPLYRDASESPRNQDYHWNQNGETLYRLGEQMGQAMVAMLATPEGPDTTPPSPDPPGFATPPTALNSATITMTANTASDTNGVQYRFVETSGNPGGSDSGWQNSPVFTNTNVKPSTTYSYRVKARDKEATPNETAWSESASATTPATPAGVIAWAAPTVISGPAEAKTFAIHISHPPAGHRGRAVRIERGRATEHHPDPR